MKTNYLALLLSSLAIAALAEYPDTDAARKAAGQFNANKQYAEAVAAYDEAIALAKDDRQKAETICWRADVLVRDGKKADAVADLLARAKDGNRDAKIRLLSKALGVIKGDKAFAAQAREANAGLAILNGEAFAEAKDPAAKQRLALAQAGYYDALGDSTNVLACYHALLAITNGTTMTRFTALNAESEYLRKLKRAKEAVGVASNALAVALSDPGFKNQQQAWNSLGDALFAVQCWDASAEAFFKGGELSAEPRQFANRALEAVFQIAKEGRYKDAADWCGRFRKVEGLAPGQLVKSYETEGRCLNAEKRVKDTFALFCRLIEEPEFTSKVDMASFFMIAGPLVEGATAPGMETFFQFFEKAFANPEKYNLDPKQYRRLLGTYGEKAWRAMDRARLQNAVDLAAKTDTPIGPNSNTARYLRYFKEMDAFPIPEEKIKIPQDLSDFGVDPDRKIVHAKDFGWNPTNATECLQKAFDSDASTVIIDDMGSPWYIWSVNITKEKGSNKKILFKKGVVVLSAPEHSDKNRPGWYRRTMFELAGPTNLVIVGEGDPNKHDTFIGKYRNRKERFEAGFKYGGCGFSGNCRNTLIKNLYVAHCGQDALCWGGNDSFVVDCVFDDNYRQGLSIVGGANCVYKNVTFCNTFGGEPHCGVDVEPCYEVYSCPHHYFFDCHFYNNASKNFLFATSTYSPTTFYFKRCQFEASPNGNIGVLARPGIYLKAQSKAPSKIIFEDCRMDGYADGNVIQFIGSFLFDMTFRNCVVNEKGLFRKTRKPNKSPIHLNLDRPISDGFYPNAGIVTFENFKINGYRDVPLVSVADRNGKYGVNTFRGVIDHNGKEVDMSAFSYLPPDSALAECAVPDPAKLHAPEGEPTAVYRRQFDFEFGRAYYHSVPKFLFLATGKKGRKAALTIDTRGTIKPDAAFKVTTPSGDTTSIGAGVQGEKTYEYVFPEDGTYVFDANFGAYNGWGFSLVSATGADLAFQAGESTLGKAVRLSTGDNYAKYVGYFEVPGGKECCIKIQGGGVEIRDEDGEVVRHLEKDDYFGSTCILFTPKEDAIWSFRCLDTSIDMKFYSPLPGIWADDPSRLPTYGEDLSFKRVAKEYSSVTEIPTARLFPLPVKGKVAKAVDEAAAARAAFGATNTWAKLYNDRRYHYDWSEPAAQTQEQLKVAALELEALEPVRKMRDMERYAGRESEDLRRYVAFVSLYAPVLALDDAAAKKYAASPVIPDDEDFRLKVNAVISPYGAEYIEDGFYYADYAAVIKLAPFIVERLDALKVK